jgi:hypothetical protein
MKRAMLIILGVGCGPATMPVATAPTAPAPVAPAPAPASTATAAASGQLVQTTTFEAGGMHERVEGSGVALAQVPFAEWLGLPLIGTGSIHVDLRIPVVHGARDLGAADGVIALNCYEGCQLGDDVAKLRPPALRRPNAMVGNGFEFGHVAFDRIAIGVHFQHGHAEITEWTVTSPEVEVMLSSRSDPGATDDQSGLEACLRYRLKPALHARDVKTDTALRTTGAEPADDGQLEIRIAGRLDSLRARGQICDGSRPLPPIEDEPTAPTRPTLPPPPDASPSNGSGSDDLTVAATTDVKQIDDHTYEIDSALLDKLFANPMALARTARVVAAMRNGKPDGFKVYAIKPDSVLAKLGLHNGDTLLMINGTELSSVDKALEVYTKLRDARSITVDLERRGNSLTLTYKIR